MIKPKLYKWELTDKTYGLLFFSQVLQELLFHHTVDSFKSPALNTHLNAWELYYLSIEYNSGKLKKGALAPILEELKNNILTDPIIEDQHILYNSFIEKLEIQNLNAEDFHFVADALLTELNNNYWNLLKSKLLQYLPKQEENSQNCNKPLFRG